MQWIRPDFEEVNLSGEVTAYVNTDDEVRAAEQPRTRREPAATSAPVPQEASA